MDIYEKMTVSLRLARFRERTVKSYLYNIRNAIKKIGKDPEEMTEDDLLAYLNGLFEAGVSGPTIISHFSALKYLFIQVLRIHWPVKRIQRFGEFGANKPRPLTREEILKVLDAAPSHMYRTIFAMLYSSGLRISEICELRPEDLDFERNLVYIRNGKGGYNRQTTLSLKVKKMLEEHINQTGAGPWIFPSYRRVCRSGHLFDIPEDQKHINQSTVSFRFRKVVRRLKLPGKVTLHSLRHSFGTHLVEDGLSIFSIQKMMGHYSVRTTIGYLYKAEVKPSKFFSPYDNF